MSSIQPTPQCTLDSMTQDVLENVLSFLVPNVNFAQTCKYFNKVHRDVTGQAGREIANNVKRKLWEDIVLLLPCSGDITLDQALKIHSEALKKVIWIKTLFAPGQLQDLSPVAVVSSPDWFNEILRLGHVKALENELELYASPIRVAYLDYKKLSFLPKCFGELTELVWLDLHGNPLTRLPGSFGKLTKLENLNLSNTLIKYLPDSFGDLKKLLRLDLRSTQLRTIPLSFRNLIGLKVLHLKNNPALEVDPELCLTIQSLRSNGCSVSCDEGLEEEMRAVQESSSEETLSSPVAKKQNRSTK